MAGPPTRRGYILGIVAGGALMMLLLQLTSVFQAIERHEGRSSPGWWGGGWGLADGGGGEGEPLVGAILPRHSGTINHALAASSESGRPSTLCVPVMPDPSLPIPPIIAVPGLPEALRGVVTSSGRCEVLLTFGTASYLSVLRNFLAGTRRVRPLSDIVVIGLSLGVCEALAVDPGAKGAWCVTYPVDKPAGDFGTNEFADLVNVKTEVALFSVRAGLATLLVDSDISFFKDPVPMLRREPSGVDVQIQSDGVMLRAKLPPRNTTAAPSNQAGGAAGPKAEGGGPGEGVLGLNSGFMYIRPTRPGLLFLTHALASARAEPGLRQQPAVNKALHTLANEGRLRFQVMNSTQFPCGMHYFEMTRRMFAFEHPCPECVAVHNNWLVGTDAKMYRLREHLLWFLDDSRYYSDPTARYLEYALPQGGEQEDLEGEFLLTRVALRVAVATGRVLILPAFHCHNCAAFPNGRDREACSGRPGDLDACNLLAHVNVTKFNTLMAPWVREHMFRYHPLVPAAIHRPAPQQGEDPHVEDPRDALVWAGAHTTLQGLVDAVAEHVEAPVVRVSGIPEGLLAATLLDTHTPVGTATDFEMKVVAAIERAYLRQRPRHTYGVHNTTASAAQAFQMLTGEVVP